MIIHGAYELTINECHYELTAKPSSLASKRKSHNRRRTLNIGVTIIELLIVLAISVILVIIAVPAYISYTQKNRLTGAANRLYFMLTYAQSEALKQNSNVYVSIQTGSTWCYGINVGATCNCASTTCGLGVVAAGNAGQLTLTATGLVSNAIMFDPTHGEVQAAATLTFTTPGSVAITAQVVRTGAVRLCSSQVEGYQACS